MNIEPTPSMLRKAGHLGRAIACAVAVMGLSTVQAAPLQWRFSGTVVDDPDATGLQSFTGVLRYDSGVADLLPGDVSAGVYAMPAGNGFSVSFDGGAWQDFDLQATVSVLNDFAGFDAFLPIAYSASNPALSAGLDLRDFAATALSSDALPTGLFSLDGFSEMSFLLNGSDFSLRGALDSLFCEQGCAETPVGNVPEPSTLWLMGACLLPLVLRRHIAGKR